MKILQPKQKELAPLLVAIAGVFACSTANASLSLLQPVPATPATFVGNGGFSADGLGQDGVAGLIQADVPAGSTVVQAYLYGNYVFTTDPDLASRTIDFDGTPVVMQKISDLAGLFATTRADVTSQVAAKVGSGGGITDFAVNTDPPQINGVGLVVIYSNPALPATTIAVLDGSASTTGDTATFNLAAPLDKAIPGFSATMSLGSGHGFQGADGHVCGPVAQFSTVHVNGVLLTNCAGNYDDGVGANGALITVGGVGDSLNNPTPPEAPAEDDELYDLEPFLLQGDTAISITTTNPSGDDNLMLAIIAITAQATVTTEVCDDGIDNDGDGLVDAADPDCNVNPPPEICTDGIDNDLDGLVDGADPDCQADTRRITGGGTISESGVTVTHGFSLACVAGVPGMPGRLQVNWGKGNRFHLGAITEVACLDDPAISEGNPVAGFDTMHGRGTGRQNGVDGATAEWSISDAGEPGVQDRFAIRITDVNGDVVLERQGALRNGNQQAHP